MRRRGAWLLALFGAFGSTLRAQDDPTALFEQLAAQDGRARSEAYRTLSRTRPPELLDWLRSHVDGLPATSRQLVCNLLRGYPQSQRQPLDEHLMRSKYGLLRVVGAAGELARLARSGDDRARLAATAVLADGLRTCASGELGTALSFVPEPCDLQVLAALRDHMQPDLKAGLAGQLLRRVGPLIGADEASLAAVRRLLDAKDRGVRAAALACLCRFEAEPVVPLVELLREHADVVGPVRVQLEGAPHLDARLVEALATRLGTSSSPHELRQLAQLLARHAVPRVVGALADVLERGADKLHAAAAAELQRLQTELSPAQLQQLLSAPSPYARIVAADGLRRRDDRTGLDALLATAAAAGRHRAEAARALGGFRARSAVPVLLDMLDDADVEVRRRAWDALQKTWVALFPFRRFDFATIAYDPEAAERRAGIAALRAFWQQATS